MRNFSHGRASSSCSRVSQGRYKSTWPPSRSIPIEGSDRRPKREEEEGAHAAMGLRDQRSPEYYYLALLVLCGLLASAWSKMHHHVYTIEEATYTRLCGTKSILTVNGQFPGPTIYARHGETVAIKVLNRADHNITLHWHGVKQPRNPWSDGPAYITQCPIMPGASFTYRIVFSTEEGTLWWHAHSDWARATVHGAIVVYPKLGGAAFPFPRPHRHFLIVLGEWWKRDVNEVLGEMLQTGGAPNVSDAFTINGEPGDLYPCSKRGTYRMAVEHGKRYLLRVVNAAMNEELFLSLSRHRLTVVGADGCYTKPFTTNYVMITPGQTMDLLFEANQSSRRRYYMAVRAYSSSATVSFDNTTATAILEYACAGNPHKPHSNPLFPSSLPPNNDTGAATTFAAGLRGLASAKHPADVPQAVDDHLLITTSINELPCATVSCEGPNGTRLAASLNNISFVTPPIDVLSAYYRRIAGVFGSGFPRRPPLRFDFTAEDLPLSLLLPKLGTKVKVLPYNRSVEVVFQGTNLVAALNHPMHLHGHSFYVVGKGSGNFHRKRDARRYNLVDPPMVNTVGVPPKGWVAVRFRTMNPGVWFLHCHLERHVSWGMETVLIVKNGKSHEARMLPPPPDMPPC